MNWTYFLLFILIVLILLSSFFSGAETGMMSLNRYRLRHLLQKNHKAAKLASQLLERPDRLLSAILIGNTFANIVASAIATYLAVKLFGEVGVIIATALMTLTILILAEVVPKTLAALYPERFAFPAATILTIILKLISPLVLLVNGVSNRFLRLFGVRIRKRDMDQLTQEEMRTVVSEAMSKFNVGYENMMLGVLDLNVMTVDDIKVPRNEIVGIDVEESWENIVTQLESSQHTHMPIYRESIDQVLGIVHMRRVVNKLAKGDLNLKTLLDAAEEVYFVPEGTPLNVQVLNFHEEKRRIGLVVDEYGDIQGLITLEDILEQVMSEFTANLSSHYQGIQPQKDGSYLVDGGMSIRELNRHLGVSLPTEGPKTLSGLIVEYLEIIPDAAMALRIGKCAMEVIQMEGKTIKLVRLWPPR